jgi:hypothetical protein
MNKTIHPYQFLYIFGVPLLIILGMVFLSKSYLFQQNPEQLTIGITFDLVFTSPLLYFLFIRKKTIPNTTVVPLFILGIIITSIIIPKDHQFLITQIKHWVLPIVETSVFILIVYKIRQTRKAFKVNKKETNHDFYELLKEVTATILPKKISILFSTEIAVIYYGFINGNKHQLQANEFTYHKHSSVIALLSVFIFLIIGETAIIHYLLQKWSLIAAWALTILSIYTGFQLFGIIRSMGKRPIVITESKLHLKHGLFSETEIPLSEIESFEQSSKSIEFNDDVRRLSPLGELTSYNFIIRLKTKQNLVGLYGFKKEYLTIVFHVDDKIKFREALELKLNPNEL